METNENENFSLAIFFVMFASLSTASGMLFLKIGIIKEEQDSKNKSLLTKLWWVTGLLLLGAGQFFNAMTLKYGSVLLMSQTSPFTIIHTAYLSPLVLGESFLWIRDGVTIFVIAVGAYVAIIPPRAEEIVPKE